MAISKLNIDTSLFHKLCVLCSIFPVISENKKTIGNEEGWFYTIEDIKRIYYSEAYEIVKGNKKREDKREMFLKKGITFKKVTNLQVNYVTLIKNKYSCFGESLCDLGNSVRGLYFAKLFNLGEETGTLKYFEKFVTEKKILKNGFMSQRGIYFSFEVEGKIIMWMVPYIGKNLCDLIEAKKYSEEDKLNDTTDSDEQVLDFEHLIDDSSECNSENLFLDDINKIDSNFLNNSIPLLEMHVKLVLLKLEKMKLKEKEKLIFENIKFYVETKSIKTQLEFAIEACGGRIVTLEQAEYIICEQVDLLKEEVTYVQPQFIFDCLNQNKFLSTDLYSISKALPEHLSPFPNVFDKISSKTLNSLSNTKKNRIIDKIKNLD